MSATEGITRAADRLREARHTGVPSAPIAEFIESVEDAYAVQAIVMTELETASNPLVGHKVGLTSVAVQKQLGVDQPDFGVLLADMEVPPGAVLDVSQLIQPKVEAEIAFILGQDVEAVDRESVIAAVDWIAPAIEIVDSRIRDWKISLLDTVADNASSGMYILGDARVRLDEVDLPAIEMSMKADDEVVSTGFGRDCLGDPINALVWVARTASAQGRPLRAGEVVLSGALGPMVVLEPGSIVHAVISGVGSVTLTTTRQEMS